MRSEPSPSVARGWCVAACCWCACLFCTGADAASLAEKARENGCTKKPTQVVGASETYKCETASGSSYFNLPGAASGGSAARAAPTPAGFPKVDAGTQKGRDDMRRKVLSDELAAEQKLLAEARANFRDGTPPPLPEEKADAQRYADRLGKLRVAVSLHEKNIDALKKELSAFR